MSDDRYHERLESLFSGPKPLGPAGSERSQPGTVADVEALQARVAELETAVAEARQQAVQERKQREVAFATLSELRARAARMPAPAGLLRRAAVDQPVRESGRPAGVVLLRQLLAVPRSYDSEDARRRQLLNILLVGLAVLALLALLAFLALTVVAAPSDRARAATLALISFLSLITFVVIFWINRYGSGQLASLLFVLIFTALPSLVDTPQEVVSGRSLILFSIPIIMAPVLMQPWTSFLVAALSSLVVAIIAVVRIGATLPVPTMVVFFALALVAWLSARSLQAALGDLRLINQELDQRVADRTRDLAETLARERAEASKSQAILEGIADGVIVFDNTGQAIVSNPAIRRLIERSPDEIIGSDIRHLMGNHVVPDDQEKIIQRLKGEAQHLPSLRFQWDQKTLSVSFAPVQVTADDVIGTVAVFRDFTREAEVERMKSAFVSMVSHELRTPLNAILGYTEMFLESVYGPLSEKQRSATGRIMTNTRRLLSLVNDLLDQAQIEAGRVTLQFAPFSPGELIDGLYGVMGQIAQAKGLQLTSEIAPEVPATLSGDSQRLHQVLVNLVQNAIKFTPQGVVHVRIATQPDACWSMAVADSGAGIPPEAQAHVFEPFWQVDGSSTRSHAGVGLGLSIVKQLVTLMGGEISLTSEVGRGSTFTVTLPLEPPQEKAG